MKVVEVYPLYGHADVTQLMELLIVVDALGDMVSRGTMEKHKDGVDRSMLSDKILCKN